MNTDLMAYVDNATRRKLRRENVPTSDHDDCLQNAKLHAWQAYQDLADKPEAERLQLSAYRGSIRCHKRITSEPRTQGYQDALDHVHTPTAQEYNQGIVGKWEMSRPGRKKYSSCQSTDDELVAEIIPEHLQEYVAHKRMGIPQSEVAAIHNVSVRTLQAIYAEVRKRIKQRAAESEAESSSMAWIHEIRNTFTLEADEITSYSITTDNKPQTVKAVSSKHDTAHKPLSEFVARRLGFAAIGHKARPQATSKPTQAEDKPRRYWQADYPAHLIANLGNLEWEL